MISMTGTRMLVLAGLVLTGLLGAIPAAFGESDKAPTQQELQERIARLLESRAGGQSETASSEGRTLTLPMTRRFIPSVAGSGSSSAAGLQRRQLTEGDFRAGRSAVITLPASTIAPRQLGERDFLGNRLAISGSSSAPAFPRRPLSERDFLGRR